MRNKNRPANGKFVLHHTKQKKNANTYVYYSLAWYYRKDKKPYRNIIHSLGTLDDLEIEHYKKCVDCLNFVPNMRPCDITDISVVQSNAYLSCAVALYFWDYWHLSSVFNLNNDDDKITIADIAKILSVIRFETCSSKTGTVELYKETTLPALTGISPKQFSKYRIFNELSKIEDYREKLGKHIFDYAKQQKYTKGELLFYDLSSGNFSGLRCVLAKWGHSKDGYCTHVVLLLVITPEGYPVYWDVLEGNSVDVNTIEGLVSKMEKIYGKFESVFCFDRGMVSDDNLKLLQDKKIEYITALDGNQMDYFDTLIDFQTIDRIKTLDYQKDTDTIRKIFTSKNFDILDDSLYFKELVLDNEIRQKIEKKTGKLDLENRRYFLGFNPELAYLNDKHRKQRVADFIDWIDKYNQELKLALADRKEETVGNVIKKEKRRRKITDVTINYQVEEYQVENENKKGKVKKSKTYRIIPKPIDDKAYAKAKKHDGLWMLVTNITLEKGAGFLLKNKFETFFEIYRLKNNIEEAFRILSNFNEIEPFYVYNHVHVKAHFTVCVLSYLISITILEKIRNSKNIKNMDLHNIFKELKKCKQDIIKIADNQTISKTTETTVMQKKILKTLGCSELVTPKYLGQNKIVHV